MHSSACAPDHVVGFRSVFFLDWHNHLTVVIFFHRQVPVDIHLVTSAYPLRCGVSW